MEPIRYTLSFPAPHTHYVEVAASVPTAGRAAVELMMAVWTPGSYLIREYARHVEGVTATSPDGRDLAVEKSAKNRWRITTAGVPSIDVTYRVYGREMSVRTNWIEARFAFLNGAATFITLADDERRPHEIAIVPAREWTRSFTGLAAGDEPHRYRAPDFDTLVDSPILVGSPAVYEFAVDGVPHLLVNEGESGVFDGLRAARDVEAIVHEHLRMWGGALPYEKYVFLNLITEAGGGLEHRNSAVLMASRWSTRTRKAYLAWLELASHEFFHVWNVKQLRPIELGPFDYEREAHTRSLWAVEGITEYYGHLMLHRAGLTTRDEFLESLSDKIESLQTTPGRLVQSAAQASYDAWIKLYRPDENTPNTSISYYTKGAVIAFLLDTLIRHGSRGARSLDDVMRVARQQFSGARGFTGQQLRGLVEDASGRSLSKFWADAIDGTAELKYAEALDYVGLRFKPDSALPERQKAWLGAATKIDEGRLVITQVKRGTPAWRAGLNVDDELIAIDELRVRADRLDQRLEQYIPGERVSLLVARREQLVPLTLTFGAEPPRLWRLEVDPVATPTQTERLHCWLKGVVENGVGTHFPGTIRSGQ